MSPDNISFREAFDDLSPLELKQMVFKWAASDNNSEIQIRLFHDSEERLNAPAVDFLAKLKEQYSADIYTQALHYLTGPTLRWVFIIDTQPHRYLFRAFRHSVPMKVRERITHAYLPRVTLNGLIDPMTLSTSFETPRIMGLASPLRHTDYFTRLGSKEHYDRVQIRTGIKQDIAGGIMLLPSTLPWLKKLDLSLDIMDCLGGEPERSMGLFKVNPNKWGNVLTYGPLPAGLGALVNLKKITSLDIRVIWDGFLKKEQTFQNTFDGDTEKKLHDLSIKALHLSVPARRVVSHPNN